jgi:hypothetical protein
MAKRLRIEPICQPTLFDMEKFEKAADFVEKLERPFCERGLFLRTSAFTAIWLARPRSSCFGNRRRSITKR